MSDKEIAAHKVFFGLWWFLLITVMRAEGHPENGHQIWENCVNWAEVTIEKWASLERLFICD